jgi:hypothetical protein
VLSFSEDDQFQIFRLVASFLHLGNIELGAREINSMEGTARLFSAPILLPCPDPVRARRLMSAAPCCSLGDLRHGSPEDRL